MTVNAEDPDWQRNAIGRLYSHKYGYGAIDTFKLLNSAKVYTSVKKQTSIRLDSPLLNQTIPENDALMDSLKIDVESMKNAQLYRLEHVQVQVFIDHQRRGDITIHLISPSNTTSKLIEARANDDDDRGFPGWYMSSVVHWLVFNDNM
jgi:kexin